ncbi:DUF1592 domain-containing protein [Haloferula sp.]|uniref:DUF1592 domain-containing protein n=1 Tax=Haloferula sp. TaxID=2497595 RepID=UPI0032A0B090
MFGVLMAVSAIAETTDLYAKEIEPLLDIYCYSCHGDGSSKGDFEMDEFGDLDAHLDDLDHWLPVWRNIRSQIMPPSDEDQLTLAEKKTLLTWIEQRVFKLDPENPDPGRVTIRRLNRTEYQNVMHDLLGIWFVAAERFPPDDSGYGFDNNGDVLSISPLLMEKYIAAAEEVVAMALPEGEGLQDPKQTLGPERFVEPDDPKETGRWMLFKENETIEAMPKIDWDGEYDVVLEYSIQGASMATDHQAQMTVRVGEQVLGEAEMSWDQRKVIRLERRMKLEKGEVPVSIFVKENRPPSEGEEELALVVGKLVIEGPRDGSQRKRSWRYHGIFGNKPAPVGEKEQRVRAREILGKFATRVFRRPVEERTLDRLVELAMVVTTSKESGFEDGIRKGLVACLCSPRFLFRAEVQPDPNDPGRVVSVDEFALASRLSFFLWESMPDEELMRLAAEGKLRENLRAQVDRMLADDKSERMVKSFVGQWLQARDVTTLAFDLGRIMRMNRKSAEMVFNYDVRAAMQRETELYFEYILRENRPVEELVSSDYTFLNEPLADYYGVDGVRGDEFVKVDLSDQPERGGVLTQGTYLVVTSNPTRTSPVKRGQFVLENILGTPAPPPPPDVPELEEPERRDSDQPTMREMIEVHRDNPDCRGCHARMDPIGLGLENFDAVGRYRATDFGKDIDAAGVLVTGEGFADIGELKKILAGSRRQDVYRCVSEKLLTYAIGRGVEYFDAPTIDSLVKRLEEDGGGLRDLVIGVVESAPFQKRRGTE